MEALTEQQRRVLLLVMAGCLNKEIAARLGVSLQTVKWHVGHLCAIFGAENRAGLVARAAGFPEIGRSVANVENERSTLG